MQLDYLEYGDKFY